MGTTLMTTLRDALRGKRSLWRKQLKERLEEMEEMVEEMDEMDSAIEAGCARISKLLEECRKARDEPEVTSGMEAGEPS